MARVTETNMAPVTAAAPGGDNWLSQVNNTIKQFRDLISLAKELTGIAGQDAPAGRRVIDQAPPEPAPAVVSAPRAEKLLKVLTAVANSPYGEKSLNELLAEAGPVKIRDIIGLVQNAVRLQQ